MTKHVRNTPKSSICNLISSSFPRSAWERTARPLCGMSEQGRRASLGGRSHAERGNEQICSLQSSSRRGTAYLLVLAVTMIVATLGLGALLAVRGEARITSAAGDIAEVRLYALSAIELGRLWISKDSNWRSNRSQGVWATGQPIGSGSFTLEVTDPIDGNLANRPHDPVVMKATAVKGQARQILQVALVASPTPLPALAYPLHVGGQVHIRSGKRLTAKFATISTNGDLCNEGTITGNVEALIASNRGDVNGMVKLGVPAKAFPSSGVAEMYASLGTTIAPGNSIDKRVLGPAYNPWGATNADGVYVIRTSSNLTIRNTRIYGTLVVICPSKRLTLDNVVLLQPVRADYPALIVTGDLELRYASTATPLSESAQAVNFNPPGAPYQGAADADYLDQYPSEIQGLVHVTGTLKVSKDSLIRGAVICESTASADAADYSEFSEIVYDPNLYANPPQGYTTEVKMVPQPGSWQQVVD